MKYKWPFINLAKPFKIRGFDEVSGTLCMPRSANIEGGKLYIYESDVGYDGVERPDFEVVGLSLSDARKLGRFIRDTIGLEAPARKVTI